MKNCININLKKNEIVIKIKEEASYENIIDSLKKKLPSYPISLIRNCQESIGHMVLSPKGEDKYEMKYVPEDFDRYDQGFFGRAKPEYIIVKGECLEKLKQQGYEMDCWQKGIPLAINNKHPDSIKLKGF